MRKYTVDFKVSNSGDSSYLEIPINEKVEENDSFGDKIGIYKETGCLEFLDYIDPDDKDIRYFVKTYFKDYKAVLGFIRRVTDV